MCARIMRDLPLARIKEELEREKLKRLQLEKLSDRLRDHSITLAAIKFVQAVEAVAEEETKF